jgi:uncharacterized OB-fold protein
MATLRSQATDGGPAVAGAVDDEQLLLRFPDVRIDQDNREHYRGRLDRTYLVNRCRACGRWHEPPRSMCPACWSDDVVPTPISGKGTVHLLTLLHQGPPSDGVGYEQPWPLVAVEIVEQPGLRIESTVVGCAPGEVTIGMPVELTWIEVGGVPAPVFRPASRAGRA